MRAVLFSKVCVTPMLLGILVSTSAAAPVRRDPPQSIHGAVYLPMNTYNAPQMWKNFSPAETKRDFGYAQRIHINALRVWLSYEYWQTDPVKFQTELDQMLAAGHEDGIRFLLSLFENDGVDSRHQDIWSSDPHKAYDVPSPSMAIATGTEGGWEPPRQFVEWFMKRYGNDDRVLAVEVMNEPGDGKGHQAGTVPFAKSMFKTAKLLQGTVPLTIGAERIEIAEEFIPLGLDIIQFHVNFPPSVKNFDEDVQPAIALGKKTGLPVWLTEWQRIRTGGSGFSKADGFSKAEAFTDYASLAPAVNSYPMGNFFWSLMVKPAYLKGQRDNGTVNGLFWADGAVVSLKDARAIAQDPTLNLKERPIPSNYIESLSKQE